MIIPWDRAKWFPYLVQNLLVSGISCLKPTEMAVNLLTVTPKMVLLLTVLPIFDPAAILETNVGAGMLEARSGATAALYPSARK
jgi:hypothetical protein